MLTMDDIIQVVNFLIDMRKGDRGIDDIDHLGNRRVKTVGEQLTNQFSVALSRMIRTIHERMNLRESESITPQDLINSRVVTTVINTFFGTSQLSQFGDQTNPLAEITHKRRISALGPGGLTLSQIVEPYPYPPRALRPTKERMHSGLSSHPWGYRDPK